MLQWPLKSDFAAEAILRISLYVKVVKASQPYESYNLTYFWPVI